MQSCLPIVSIIIPCFNSQEYLTDAIDSVLKSDFGSYEVIVIDDGSTEPTAPFINQHYAGNNKITCITQINQGLAAARNTGIKHASGELLVFLDADDIILPEKLSEQVSFLSRQKNCDLVYSLSEWFIGSDQLATFPVRFPVYSGDVLPNLLFGNFIHVNTVMVRKKAVVNAGFFDPALRELEDWDLWLRMAMQRTSFGVIQKVLSKVRVHSSSMTANQDRMNKAMVNVLKKNRPCFMANYGTQVNLVNDFHYSLLNFIIKAKEHRAFWPYTMTAFSACRHRFGIRGVKAVLKYVKSLFINTNNETTRDLEYVWRSK